MMSENNNNRNFNEVAKLHEENAHNKIIKIPTIEEKVKHYSYFGANKIIGKESYETYGKAKEIVEDAEREAKERLEHVDAIISEQKEQAYEEGYKEGMRRMEEWIAEAENYYMRMMMESERDIVELSLRIAEKVIGEGLRNDPGLVRSVVKKALKKVEECRQVLVRIHSIDYRMIREWLETGDFFKDKRRVKVVSDDSIQGGGCIIESSSGGVDAQVKTQLELIRAVLLEENK
ncbi:MAG: hypothetical protein A2Y62_08665 [Candidatus Fischerbacteria bacterium RBG_13_37_8]|uniref:Flagellar assembly protein FliH/Type III secretion system HrpE domain-containing protein n=1 Tax=Candidatus Fischerbacteria bacterium RBG_13_37_8 TaxID=1817863 RepID=A0A1F5VQS6_9BACT|nr:MAG: hypothetical protein A2Y62_08665 [Candidatus Fischerbacteria bacterium RBG_13_37_8]